MMTGLMLFGICMATFFGLLIIVSIVCLMYNHYQMKKQKQLIREKTEDWVPQGFKSDNLDYPLEQVTIKRANTQL